VTLLLLATCAGSGQEPRPVIAEGPSPDEDGFATGAVETGGGAVAKSGLSGATDAWNVGGEQPVGPGAANPPGRSDEREMWVWDAVVRQDGDDSPPGFPRTCAGSVPPAGASGTRVVGVTVVRVARPGHVVRCTG
jgi:transcription elongation factor